tara:strand:+ start:1402 stop:1662 length:261 start_codon:yes stop_codon:yes gene_type:complete
MVDARLRDDTLALFTELVSATQTESTMNDLDYNINKLNNGETIATCYCHNLTKLVEAFGGRDAFVWSVGDLTRISLKNASTVAIID